MSFADSRSVCINTTTSMHVLFFAARNTDVGEDASDGTRVCQAQGATSSAIDDSVSKKHAVRAKTLKAKTVGIPASPSLRTLRTRAIPTTHHMFSGHWRSDPQAIAAAKHTR